MRYFGVENYRHELTQSSASHTLIGRPGKSVAEITSAPTKRSRALDEITLHPLVGRGQQKLISGLSDQWTAILPKFLQVDGRPWRSWSFLPAGPLSRCRRVAPRWLRFRHERPGNGDSNRGRHYDEKKPGRAAKLPATKPVSVVLSAAPIPAMVPTTPWAKLNRPVPCVRPATINAVRTPSTVPLMPSSV